MIFFSNCKINIGLDVIEKRPDGYHNIETLMWPVRGLCDAVEILPAPGSGVAFSSSGLAVDGPQEQNLCVRACRLMQQRYGIGGVRVHLHKVVPMGAGLGGGSANAAYVIKGLSDLYACPLTEDEQEALAAELGSDTAFFIRNRPAIATGRGEILTPADLSLKGYRLVILKPEITVSTAQAYAGIAPRCPDTSLARRLRQPIETWKEALKNDFEPSVFAENPRIGALKALMYSRGAVYSAMSGSGAAVYGIFPADAAPSFGLPNIFEYQEDMI